MSKAFPVLNDDELHRILRHTKFAHLTDDQFDVLIATCQARALNPWLDHVYCTSKPGGKRNEILVMVTLQALRDIAETTGRYEGQAGPFWCGLDGVWRRVWTPSEPPTASRVGIWRQGRKRPIWGVAHWDEYAQLDDPPADDQQRENFWITKPRFMLNKCAAAIALRAAFPRELTGLYVPEEIALPRPARPVFGGPLVDETTPTSDFLFQKRLISDFELANAKERAACIEQFRARYPDLYMRDKPGWYAAVLHDLSRARVTAEPSLA